MTVHHQARPSVFVEVDLNGHYQLARQQTIDDVNGRIASLMAGVIQRVDSRGRTRRNLHKRSMDALKRYFDSVKREILRRNDDFSPGLGTFQPRQLTQQMRRALEEKRPPLNYRVAYDVNTELRPGVRFYEQYRSYRTGEATVYRGGRAEDVQEIQISNAFFTAPVVYLISKYSVDWLERMGAQFAGLNTEANKARGAIRAIEELQNRLTYQGDKDLGIFGALNHPYVDQIDSALDWGASATTARDISDALHQWANYAEEESGSTFQPDTMQIAPKLYNFIANYKFGAGDMDTILVQFQKANPHITRILKVREFNDAGPGGSHVIKFHRRGQGAADRSAELIQVMGPTMLTPHQHPLVNTLYMVSGFGGLNQREVGDILRVNVPLTR